MADAPMENRTVQLSNADLINLFGDLLTGTTLAPAKPAGAWDTLFRQAFQLGPHDAVGPYPEPWKYGPFPEPWNYGPLPDPWQVRIRLSGHYVDDFRWPDEPRPNWAIALTRNIAWLNPQPLPPIDNPLRALRRLGTLLVADVVAAGDAGLAKLDRFVDDWCGNRMPIFPHEVPKPKPDPTSLILGASLSRLAAGIEPHDLSERVSKAGERILQHGIHGPG